jgi:zinc transporter
LTASQPFVPSTQAAAFPHEHVLPGLVWAFRIRADGSAEELPAEQPIADRHDGWLWLHFNLTDGRAGAALRSLPDLPPAAVALLLTTDEHQQLHVRGDGVYGIFADLVRGLGGATEELGFLHFAMTERLLVSGRRRTLAAVEATRQALREGRKVPTIAALLEAIVEHVVDAIDGYAEELGRDLDWVEERILGTEVRDERQRLGRVRRTTVRLHRQLAGLRALFHRTERDLGGAANPRLRLETVRLLQRLDGLDHEIVALRDRAYLLQEEVTLKVAEETNRHLQVLAIVTTVLLPPTLIAGVFGMNVKGLPFTEDDGGFLWSTLLIAASIAVVVWLLRWVGITGRR